MRKRLMVIAIAVGALFAGQAAPAQAQSGRCTLRGSATILQTPSVRIYAAARRGDTLARVYGCLYSQNRRRFLGIEGDCDPGPTIDKLIVRGRYVAFVESLCNIDSSDDYVVVRDLRTGRNRFRAIAATGTPAENGEPSTLVEDLALATNGSVAWIGLWDSNSGGIDTPQPNDQYQVRKLDSTSSGNTSTVLDSGLNIDPRSLGLSPRTSQGAWIYWRKGDAPFSARLQ